jgi:predicted RNA-binding protein
MTLEEGVNEEDLVDDAGEVVGELLRVDDPAPQVNS